MNSFAANGSLTYIYMFVEKVVIYCALFLTNDFLLLN